MQRDFFVRRHRTPVLVFSLALAGFAPAAAQDPAPPPPPTFDSGADAATDLAAAQDVAAHKNRRVLVLWGENGDGPSEALAKSLRSRELSRFLLYEYRVVKIDVAADKDVLALAKRCRADLSAGAPYLTVHDAEGKHLAGGAGSTWMTAAGVDTKGLKTFLEGHQAKPLDAEKVLASHLAQAKAQNKRLIVHLGAPW